MNGSGCGDLVRGELLTAEDETPLTGTLLIEETDTFGGCVNVVRVTGTSAGPSKGFYGIFVNPTDTSQKRQGGDRTFFVWWPPLSPDNDRYYRVENP